MGFTEYEWCLICTDMSSALILRRIGLFDALGLAAICEGSTCACAQASSCQYASTDHTPPITTTAATASSATEGDADAPALLCTGTRNAGSDDTVQDDQTVRATLEEIVALVGGADNERATYGVHLLVLWFENTICATTLSAMIPFHRQTMALTICTILLSELDAHITVAKASLVNAAQNTPIYSVLRALRQVLDVLGLSCLREVSKDRFLGAQWTAFVGKLLASL